MKTRYRVLVGDVVTRWLSSPPVWESRSVTSSYEKVAVDELMLLADPPVPLLL